jgi:hypothetical protein
MNLVVAIRAEGLKAVIPAGFISVMDCQMVIILIAALLATKFPFAFDRGYVATDPIIELSCLVSMPGGTTARTTGHVLWLKTLSTNFAGPYWLNDELVSCTFMGRGSALPRTELRRRIAQPSDAVKGFTALFTLVASFACLLIFGEAVARTESAGQVRTRFCKFFPAPPANMDSPPGSSRVVPAFRRTELRLLRCFVAPRKWLRTVLAGIDGIEIVTLFPLPAIPTFSGTESRNNPMRPLRKRIAALFAFVNLPPAFLAQSETVLGTEPRFLGVMGSRHKRFLAPLAFTQWKFS